MRAENWGGHIKFMFLVVKGKNSRVNRLNFGPGVKHPEPKLSGVKKTDFLERRVEEGREVQKTCFYHVLILF